MAHYKRRRRRTVSPGRSYDKHRHAPSELNWRWMGRWPAWWDILFHTRPKRAANKRLLTRIRKGEDPDNLAWPLGNRKPHNYYW